MTVRVYLMPQITGGTGNRYEAGKRAKYVRLLSNSAVIHYGPEPYSIVMSDVSAAEHSAVMANADVRAIPEDLDSTITNAQRVTITSTLEGASIPAQWVTNGMAYRVFVRRLAGIFEILQRVHGRKLSFLQAALDDPISALPLNVRQAFAAGAADAQLDTTGITLSTTLRAALANIGSQYANRPLTYRGVTL